MNAPAESVGHRRNDPLLLASQFWSAFPEHFVLMQNENPGERLG